MKRKLLLLLSLFFAVMMTWGQTSYVNSLGVASGWYSDDTRGTTGTDLVGLTLTHYGKPGQTPTAADDNAIMQQISFVVGPSNVGALKMDKTSTGGGYSKCTISKVNEAGFATGDSWLSGFMCNYRYYTNSSAEVTVAKIGIRSTDWGTNSGQSQYNFTATKSGESAWDLVLVDWRGTNPPWTVGSWDILNTDKNTVCWRIYRQGGNPFFPAPPTVNMSLQQIYDDAYWGPKIFGAGAKVVSFQFGVGSSAQTSTSYIDYVQTNLLNGGNTVDFMAPVYNVTQDTYFNDIQSAINDAETEDGDVITVAAGTYAPSTTLTIDKELTITGAGSAVTTINVGGYNAWGIYIPANNVTFQGFTVQGNATVNQQYALKVGTGNTGTNPHINTGLVLNDIVIQGTRRTGLDLNSVDGATLTDITSTGATHGFGFSMSSCANITITDLTTSGNAWGDVGIFPANIPYQFLGLEGCTDILFQLPISLSSGNGSISVQDGAKQHTGGTWVGTISNNPADNADVTVPTTFNRVVHATRNSDGLKMHNVGLQAAIETLAVSLAGSTSFSKVSLFDLDNEDYEALNGMRIQDAIDAASNGDVISVYPGTYVENANFNHINNTNTGTGNPLGLLVNKSVTIKGVDSDGDEITSASTVMASIISGMQSNWGTNFYITVDDVTISGLQLLGTGPGFVNKAIEAIKDNFTLENCVVGANGALDMYGAVYVNDYDASGFAANPTTWTSAIAEFHISDNILRGSFSTTNGPGTNIPPASIDMEITGNSFVSSPGSTVANAGIYVTGYDEAVAWRKAPARMPNTITGNTFANEVGSIFLARDDEPSRLPSLAQIQSFIANNTLPGSVYITDNLGALRLESTPTATTNNVHIRKLIAPAITSAAANDFIHVGAGTYAEGLSIDKSITLLGPNELVSPNGGTRVAEAVLMPSGNVHALQGIANGIDVTIKGFKFDMDNASTNYRFVQIINFTSNEWTFEHNIFTNAPECINGNWYITGNTDPFTLNFLDNYIYGNDESNGIAIWGAGTNNVTIEDNVWQDNQAWAFNVNRVVGTIDNNQFIDTDPISPSTNWNDNQNGFIIAGPGEDIDITNNSFSNNYSSINLYENVTGTLDIMGNFFDNTITYGIKIRDFADPTLVTLNITSNSFTDTQLGGFAIMNLTDPQYTYSATCNWFGTTVQSEVTALVQGNVTVLPWLMDGTDTAPTTPGFQPENLICYGGYPVWNQDTGEDFTNVQDAINDEDTQVGDVIIVNGTHNVTSITVTKGLKIAAGKGGAKFNGLGTRAGEGFIVNLPAGETFILGDDPEEVIVEGWTTGVLVQSTNLGNVTIEGVKFQNNTTAVDNQSNVVVNAVHNYWGAANGPLDASDDRPTGFYNPLGQGDPVSNKVEYTPWYSDFDLTQLPIDIAVYNPTCGRLEVRLKPNTTFTSMLTNLIFTVAWDSTVYNGLFTVVGTPAFNINFIEYQRNTANNLQYAVFGADYANVTINCIAGTEIPILTLQLDQSAPKFTTTDFFIAQDSWVGDPLNNGAYYIQLYADDYTGYNYWNADDVYVSSCDLELDAKVFLQGPYDAATNNMLTDVATLGSFPLTQPFNVAPYGYNGTESITSVPANAVDWVLVGLRDDASDLADDFRVAGLLYKDGKIRGVDGNLISIQNPALMPNTTYHAVVYHRNHMPVMSATEINIPNTSAFDFSQLANGYKGTSTENPLITLETGVYGMIAGDHSDYTLNTGAFFEPNQTHDGRLKYSGSNNDRGSVLRRIKRENSGSPFINGIATGYFNQDITMNKIVRYSGSGNDPRLIIQNLIELKGTYDLNAFYDSKVPGWVSGAKAGEIANEGPLDITLAETPEEMLVNIRTNESIYEGLTDNIQFTLCWDELELSVENLLSSYQSDFLIEPQGEPVLYNGKMYQVFVTVEAIPLPAALTQGEELTLMKFYKDATTGSVYGKVSVAQDSWTAAHNGDYYISVWGTDNTGKILQNAVGISDPEGAIALNVYPNPVSQGWIYVSVVPKATETLTLTLSDLSGRIVSTRGWNVTEGTAQSMTLELDGLAKGAYTLTVTGSAAESHQRIIVQ